jgi:hypothetical protein
MKTNKEIDDEFEIFSNMLEQILNDGVQITLAPSHETVEDAARRLQGERDYHNLHESRVKNGKCGRCGSRSCVCE